jgi:glycosyltransferase involved in cell wall biosynthesis
MTKAKLSVVIITRNEIANIERCLRSVSFAQEVVVLDNGSTDGTVELARELGAVVHTTTDWPGFGLQKNRALALATGEWVLSLDADEWVSDALREELLEVIDSPEAMKRAYDMPRLSSFCGQYMRHGGWYPDRVLRLFPRGQARFSDDAVHERVNASLPVFSLRCDLMHESTPSLEWSTDKMNRYSTARAADLNRIGKRGSITKAVLHGAWAFFRGYVLRRGFLDGRRGFILALANAHGTFYRYAKLWLLQEQAAQ